MSNTRDIKRRIKSIQSTQKITKAMEMVAASKMRKAVAQVQISREYAKKAWQVVQNIAHCHKKYHHPLLKKPKVIKKVAILAISSNRGLCGGFNSNLVKEAIHTCDELKQKNINFEFITFGKKGADQIRKHGFDIIANFDKPDLLQNITTISPITHLLLDGFQKKSFQQVILVFTDFVSSLHQKPISKVLLPLKTKADADIGNVTINPSKKQSESGSIQKFYEYKFEPSPVEVLNDILPRILELQIYQACLESDASEHSSRMMAMSNAYGAATDMIDELSLAYNKARQAAITQEIAEIVSGANAI